MKIFVVKGVAKGDRVYYEGLNFKIHAGNWLPNYECYFQVKKDDLGKYTILKCIPVDEENSWNNAISVDKDDEEYC